MLVARSVPRPRSTVLRLAIATLYRPGALTPTVVISLGLGLALLVTVLEVDANLRQQFAAALPEKAPSFYSSTSRCRTPTASTNSCGHRRHAPPWCGVPMLRGRIVGARGTKAEDLKPKPDAAWVLQSDRGITYHVRPAGRIAADGRRLVGQGLFRAEFGVVREKGRRRLGIEDRPTTSRSTCSAAT